MSGITKYTDESWKKTNADRIRAMSDEELNELLVTAQYSEDPPWDHAKCIRDWLKQEVNK